jgi:predicted membrane-bound spermidine synthase
MIGNISLIRYSTTHKCKNGNITTIATNLATHRNFLAFLMAVLFFASLSAILFELALTRVFSIVLWYDYAFMAISVAFFGLGVGSLLVHMQKDVKVRRDTNRLWRWLTLPDTTPEAITRKIVQHALIYAISVPAFVFAITLIPPDTSFIYLYYLVSSIPFFFAGSIMALVFFAMPRQITKLYFADLIGASSAALILDPLMQALGAESVLLLTSLLVAGSAVAGAFAIKGAPAMAGKAKASSAAVLAGLVALTVLSSPIAAASGIGDYMHVRPGPNKGLYWQLRNPDFDHISARWNSFSRVDVTRLNNFTAIADPDHVRSSRELANIIIDADAGTPIYPWNGDKADLAWMRQFMDHVPYDMTDTKHTLVIGSGGGQDVMMAFACGSQKVTAVELNPLIVSDVRRFGGPGNVYDNPDVDLHIDDGRRFISSSSDKYDMITIKLVDSWAAQLAGGYALSENYLYTVEAFQQYIRHLDKGGVLAMIRWNFELPRLVPVVAEAVARETGKSVQDVSRNIIVVEDRPGLYFGRTSDTQDYYPVLVMAKATPFTDDQVNLVKQKAADGRAEVMILGSEINPPFDRLFLGSSAGYNEYVTSRLGVNTKMPTDDSPFYFAREPVPRQMLILLGTVLAISAGLSAMLVYHARKTGARRDGRVSMAGSGFVLFAIFIGLGFMILEITFIQKFLLLLGTPIMALTVILFSILLSSGIGAYVSGRLFRDRPHRAVFISVPVLAGIVVLYLIFLQGIIAANITMELQSRAALTFALLFPAGLMMGFQFPSLIRMSSQGKNGGDNDTTLLWGINIIASIVGTVLAALLAMIIGFDGNLIIGLAMYAGAGASALLAYVGGRKHVVTLRE